MLRSLAAAGLGLALAFPAQAALIPLDSPFGPGTIIRDTSTGLDFLRPDVTLGLTVTQTLAELEPGGRFETFRFAMTPEFESVAAYFGFCRPAFVCDIDAERLQEFLDLFGAHRGEVSQTLRAATDSGRPPEDDLPELIALDVFLFQLYSDDTTTIDLQLVENAPRNVAFPLVLVRDEAVVAEPGALALFTLGAAAAVARARRRRSFVLLVSFNRSD